MNEVLMILADNMLLLIGLVAGLALVGLKKLATKTENKLDDKIVAEVESRKESIVAMVAKKLSEMIRPKKDEPKK